MTCDGCQQKRVIVPVPDAAGLVRMLCFECGARIVREDTLDRQHAASHEHCAAALSVALEASYAARDVIVSLLAAFPELSKGHSTEEQQAVLRRAKAMVAP